MKTTDFILSVPQAGEMLGLGRSASYEAARRGEIPTIRLGRSIGVPRAALEEMLRDPQAWRPYENEESEHD